MLYYFWCKNVELTVLAKYWALTFANALIHVSGGNEIYSTAQNAILLV